MYSHSIVGAMALAVALFTSVSSASAGTWAPVEIHATGAADGGTIAQAASEPACMWTYWRGWHRAGRFGTWHVCQPGPAWRYAQRCWIGPHNERHCRFAG